MEILHDPTFRANHQGSCWNMAAGCGNDLPQARDAPENSNRAMHELPSTSAALGPTESGVHAKGEAWNNTRQDGLPSPEPKAPQSSPSGSETGSNSSCTQENFEAPVESNPPQRHSPQPHSPSSYRQQRSASSAPRKSKGKDTGPNRGSTAIPQPSGKDGSKAPWLRVQCPAGGNGKKRSNNNGKCNHLKQPSAEQLTLNRTLSSLDNPTAVLDALAAAVEAGIEINATNLSTGLHRIASRGSGNKTRLLRNPRLGALLQAIFNCLKENGQEFSERELATVAWAVGKLEVQVGLLLIELRRECERRGLKKFNWHDISNLAWGHAVAVERGEGWENFFSSLVVEAQSRPLQGCAPQALSNLAWSLTTLSVPATSLLEKLASYACQGLGLSEFKPQEISALSWALAAGGVTSPEFFSAVSTVLVERELEGYNPQKIAALACAFAQTGNQADDFFDMVEEAMTERAMASFNPANTASIAWAFASAKKERCEEVLSVVEERVWHLGMQGFDDVQIVLLVWSLAASNYRGPSDNRGRDTLSMVEVELRRRKIKSMPDDNLATIVWAFSRQGHPGGGGLLRVQKELLKRGWLDPQNDGRFTWSLTNRRRGRKTSSKSAPRPPQPLVPDGAQYGLQQMGIARGVDVVVRGGCWAVEGMSGPDESGAAARTAGDQGFTVEGGEDASKIDAGYFIPEWARPCAH